MAKISQFKFEKVCNELILVDLLCLAEARSKFFDNKLIVEWGGRQFFKSTFS